MISTYILTEHTTKLKCTLLNKCLQHLEIQRKHDHSMKSLVHSSYALIKSKT
jgi:hypothetical protein